MKHPPGNEIYRDGNIGVFEIDGRKSTVKLYILYISTINLTFPKYKGIAETYVYCQNCSWKAKYSTMMSSPFYFM
jgi:hypothetical protein